MSYPVLTHFHSVIQDSAQDGVHVIPGALVEFFSQGATVSEAAPITMGAGATADVYVYDPGALVEGSLVQGKPGNAAVLVVAEPPVIYDRPGPHGGRVKLRNDGSSQVTLDPGERLMLLTDRPGVFSDPGGLEPAVGAWAVADADGRVSVYIDRPRFDYLVSAAPPEAVGFDGSASSGPAVSVDQFSWNHDVGTGERRGLIVAIAWASASPSPPSIDWVKYDGTEMVPVMSIGAAPRISLYSLRDPGEGTTKPIEVKFSAGGVNAVGGSVSVRNLDPTGPIAMAVRNSDHTQSGSSTPWTAIAGSTPHGLVVDAVAVLAQGTEALHPAAGQTERWEKAVTSQTPLVLGAGSTKQPAAPGDPSPGTMTWTITQGPISVNRRWSAVAMTLRPRVLQVHCDAVGGTAPHPSWRNARDYPSLQAAIDSLDPERGGVVYVPAGVYVLSETLRIGVKNLTLQGDGPGATILRHGEGAFDLVEVADQNPPPQGDPERIPVTIRDLQLDGAAKNGSCLVLSHGAGQLKNLVIRGADGDPGLDQGFGLLMTDGTIISLVEGVRFIANMAAGALIEDGTTTVRFLGCTFSGGGRGVEVDNSVTVTVLGCTFEDNEGTPEAAEGLGIHARAGAQVQAIGCRFTRALAQANEQEQFIFADGAWAPAVTGCWFDGGLFDSQKQTQRAARFRNTPESQFANNLALNMANEEDGVVAFERVAPLECNDCVELCNRDLDSPSAPRIGLPDNVRVFSLSQGGIGLYRWNGSPDSSLAVASGAVVFDQSAGVLKIRVVDGPYHDDKGEGGGTRQPGVPLTFEHSVTTTKPDRVLYVTVVSEVIEVGDGLGIGAVKFDDTPMHLIAQVTDSGVSNAVYRLFAPNPGTHAVTIDVVGEEGTLLVSAGSESFHHAVQSDGAISTAQTGVGHEPMASVSAEAFSLVCDSLAVSQGSEVVPRNPGEWQTLRHDRADTEGGSYGVSSTSSTRPAGGDLVEMRYTLGGDRPWSMIAWEVKGTIREWKSVELE